MSNSCIGISRHLRDPWGGGGSKRPVSRGWCRDAHVKISAPYDVGPNHMAMGLVKGKTPRTAMNMLRQTAGGAGGSAAPRWNELLSNTRNAFPCASGCIAHCSRNHVTFRSGVLSRVSERTLPHHYRRPPLGPVARVAGR